MLQAAGFRRSFSASVRRVLEIRNLVTTDFYRWMPVSACFYRAVDCMHFTGSATPSNVHRCACTQRLPDVIYVGVLPGLAPPIHRVIGDRRPGNEANGDHSEAAGEERARRCWCFHTPTVSARKGYTCAFHEECQSWIQAQERRFSICCCSERYHFLQSWGAKQSDFCKESSENFHLQWNRRSVAIVQKQGCPGSVLWSHQLGWIPTNGSHWEHEWEVCEESNTFAGAEQLIDIFFWLISGKEARCPPNLEGSHSLQ